MSILQQIKVPLVAVNDTSLTVVDILFANASFVKKGDNILVFETSKTTYDVVAETDGYIQYLCETGSDYEVNDIVANIYSDKAEVPEIVAVKKIATPSVADKEAASENAEAIWEGETLFTPAAMALINAAKLEHALFKGRDLVSKEDVETVLGIPNKKMQQGSTTKRQLPVDTAKVDVEKLSSNKKREIEYLAEVQATGLTSTVNTIVETGGIFAHINPSLKVLKNSLLPVIIYETARLLEKYKALNAYFTGDAVAFYKQVNIGFAIDIDKGLKVLKIADTAQKGMHEIEADILALSGKYLDDTLNIEDLTDISFTITDLSAEAVAFFRPLVNMMNSAILAISSIDPKLDRCMLSVSFDHRVTEGKLVAQFLHELKKRLESYLLPHYQGSNQNIQCFKCYKTLEEDLGDVGFAKCITPRGEEAYICQSCLKGF